MTNLGDDMSVVAHLQLALTTLYLSIGNLSGAMDTSTSAYNSASSLKDYRLLITSIPKLVFVSLMKLRFQSSDALLKRMAG